MLSPVHFQGEFVENFNEQFNRFLIDLGCVSFEPRKLSGGRESPFYIDCRELLVNLETKKKAAFLAYQFAIGVGLRPDYFLGVPQGAVPWGEALNDMIDYRPRSEIPATILRPTQKEHGDPKHRNSVGALIPGKIVLVEDVVKNGTSAQNVIGRIRDQVTIQALLAFVDRGELGDGGKTTSQVLREEYGIDYWYVTDVTTLLPQAAEEQSPPKKVLKEIVSYYEKYGHVKFALEEGKLAYQKHL